MAENGWPGFAAGPEGGNVPAKEGQEAILPTQGRIVRHHVEPAHRAGPGPAPGPGSALGWPSGEGGGSGTA